MEFMFTKQELEEFQQKRNNKQIKVDKEKNKLDKYQIKSEILLEKQIAKENLRHIKFVDKTTDKWEKKIERLQHKENSEKLINEVNVFYEQKLFFENEKYEVANKNFYLAKGDLLEGVQTANENNIRIHLESIENKISKLNWRRNWKKLSKEKNDLSRKQLSYQMYEDSDKKFRPFIIKYDEFLESKKTQFQISKIKFQIWLAKTSQFTFKDWINIKIWTIPAWLAFVFLGTIITAILTKTVDSDMIYGPAVLLVIAIFSGAIFSKIPIWKKYFGGAVMGSMFVGAFLVYFNVIGGPNSEASEAGKKVFESINVWFKQQDFLSLYISILLVGAVLLMPRKLIIKATGGFFILIIAGSLLGLVLAMIAAAITGMSVEELIIYYALPILADGNGGGIQPMGNMAEENGYDKGVWVSRALAISTLASILSVVAAAIVNGLGKSKPSLSGKGKLMLRDIHTVDRSAKVNDRQIASSLLLIFCIYIFSNILAKYIFTESLVGILIPNFAWMIVLCLILNLLDIIPLEMRLGAEKINKFISKQTTWLLMVGVGILFIDIEEFIGALNFNALLVTILFVLGAAVGPMLIAKFFKFNCVEASVSAGLCMTAQGGSGAIAVLGTSDRINLMPFGQITCRIAGSIVLIFAAIAFAKWPVSSVDANVIAPFM